MARKVILIVLDSFGVGELPDAERYGDQDANTLLHIAQAVPDMRLPNLEALGLGKILPVPGMDGGRKALGAYGKAAEASAGKDTTVGHWELAGLLLDKPFPTYPNGFPEAIISAFEAACGLQVLGNKPASGTAILEELGPEHLRTGQPIVYTSADSVFQIAAHESVIPVKKLYEFCEVARALLVGSNGVARVIARPFVGEPGTFTRTANRRDFSLEPIGTALPDLVKAAELPSIAVGKIEDIFAGRGFTECVHTSGNMDGMDKTLAMMEKYFSGLIFTNLVDYDMLYGHRRDPIGYARALEAFDSRLPELKSLMGPEDILILTGDHGCDPTHSGTDHTREYVPVLIYGATVLPNTDLGVQTTFADIGATAAELLNCGPTLHGTSMCPSFLQS